MTTGNQAPNNDTPQLPSHIRAMDHLNLSEEFYDAFRQLRDRPMICWPRYFLLCHSAELALKAFLILHRVPARELKGRKMRHSLKELCDRAVQVGVVLSADTKNSMPLLGEAHEKFWVRYPMETGDPVFVPDPYIPNVLELIRAVRSAIRGGDFNLFVAIESDAIELQKIEANRGQRN